MTRGVLTVGRGSKIIIHQKQRKKKLKLYLKFYEMCSLKSILL